jgi:RNA polymerase sigma factor (sigma-70 family)
MADLLPDVMPERARRGRSSHERSAPNRALPQPRQASGRHAMDGPTVGALLDRAAGGDAAAWDALVERFSGLLWGVARGHRLGDADAGDVVQTTWLRLLENLDRIEDPERLPGWLVTTSRRECLRVLRGSGREVLGSGDDTAFDLVDELAPPVDASLLESERDAALWQGFGHLPDRCQRLLRVLMAAEPPAYAQVSSALGMPVGSIGPTRMRCLERLRTALRGTGYAFEATTEGSI